jgi:hypothetical protein
MPFPRHLLDAKTFRSEPYMAAMAVIAVGMFIGAWVIGPAITREPEAPAAPAQEQAQNQPPAQQQPLSYQAMLSRPDPSPYRAPTPNFGSQGAPNYAEAAREKARAGLGGEDEPVAENPRRYRASRYYPSFDRHRAF